MKTTPDFEALRQRLACAGGRRPLMGGLAALSLAGASALLMDEDADAKRNRKQAQAEKKKKKPRKYPVCLNGQTINGSKKKMKKLLKKGATRGACATTTPAPCVPRNWTPQATFSGNGSGPSQLNAPGGISLASDTRTLLIADTGNSRVSVWTRPTATSTLWTNHAIFGSGPGNGPTEFAAPAGVKLAADGRTAWVADGGNNRIAVWTRPTASSDTWSHAYNVGDPGSGIGQLNGPSGVAVSPDTTTMWVADASNNRISVWTRPGAASPTWTNVITFGTAGSALGELAFPSDLAISADTLTAWVADFNNHRISIWTRPNATSTTWTNVTTFGTPGSSAAQFANPAQPTLDTGELTMWIADVQNDRISIWTRPSASSHTWSPLATAGPTGFGPLQLGDPFGVAISPDGATLLASDFTNSRVVVWTVDC